MKKTKINKKSKFPNGIKIIIFLILTIIIVCFIFLYKTSLFYSENQKEHFLTYECNKELLLPTVIQQNKEKTKIENENKKKYEDCIKRSIDLYISQHPNYNPNAFIPERDCINLDPNNFSEKEIKLQDYYNPYNCNYPLYKCIYVKQRVKRYLNIYQVILSEGETDIYKSDKNCKYLGITYKVR